MSQITVYHYTDLGKIGSILGKASFGHPSGLEPITGATYALLEPMPDTWVNNPYFPLIWESLTHHLGQDGKLLLEIDVDPDEVAVADRGYMEAMRYKDKTGIPEQYLHASRDEAQKATVKNGVRLGEYLDRQDELGFSLPEVIIFQHVPLERIRVSAQQPLLEEDLAKKMSIEEHRYLLALITGGYVQEELVPWRKTYEASHGSLEITRRRKEAF